jgi:hypothetical protein
MSDQNTMPEAKGDEEEQAIRDLIARLEREMAQFIDIKGIETNLTGTQRRRLIGSGVRNNGFVDKAFDIARDNPDFMPPHFNIAILEDNMHLLEELRQLVFVLQQFLQMASNAHLIQSDHCYRDALRIYGSLQEQTRNRVPGAEPLFEALRNFFRRRRRTGDEPTEMQLERDIKRLLHGKADGEIIVQHESPQVSKGVHKVIDSIHTGRSAFKETEQGTFDDSLLHKEHEHK